MSVTIEISTSSGPRIIKKTLSSLEEAKSFLVNFKGSGFIGYTDDGTFAIVVP